MLISAFHSSSTKALSSCASSKTNESIENVGFFLGPFSFKTPRGGRVTVFGALLTVPLVLGVNKYLDDRKGKERKKKKV